MRLGGTKGGAEWVEEYTLRYGNGNADHCLRTDCFVGKGNVLTLRGRN
jgi:hypothetical protein